jgi:hypothetical protein
MLRAVPPWTVPTCTVVKGGSKRPLGSPRATISSAILLSSTISSAAAITALAPSAGFDECAAWPCTWVLKVTTLLCASATSSSVGSPTMTALGLGTSRPKRAMASEAPRHVVSSS